MTSIRRARSSSQASEVVSIIEKLSRDGEDNYLKSDGDGEYEIDFDQLSSSTLVQLDAFVSECQHKDV